MADRTTFQNLIAPIAYTDTTAITVGYLPANALITNVYVLIGTDFEAGVIDVGNATTANQYANDIAATSVGRIAGTCTNVGAVESTTDPTQITAIYVPGSTSPAQGSGYVVVEYAQL